MNCALFFEKFEIISYIETGWTIDLQPKQLMVFVIQVRGQITVLIIRKS